MSSSPVKAAAFGVIVCVTSWLGLAVGAGNIGLQGAVGGRGPESLLTEHPLAILLLLGIAFGVAFALALSWRVDHRFAVPAVGAVAAGDLVGSFVLAPVLIGELEVVHGPLVLLIISFFGTQIAAAAAGVLLGARTSPDRGA